MYKLNYFNFEEKNDKYLITNDIGEYEFLSKDNFKKLLQKKEIESDIEENLIRKGFIYKENEEIFATKQAMKLRCSKEYLLIPTSLHIFVVSKNCNFNCIYCQAGDLNENENFKMTFETAKKAVDIALQSPANYLSFEFQGGEPLTNFETIKYIIEYSKENKGNKNIDYNLVSNLTLLTDNMIDFFVNNDISICTSIDGGHDLQNINRPYLKHDSYIETVKKIKMLQNKGIKVNAIETTTKFSLNKYKEIVDEYINLGLENIFVRPLTRLGKADNNWIKVGYSPEDFISFYKKALEYIISKNQQGIFLAEGNSTIFLKKILLKQSINYMDLRSPCGGAIGQLAYYYDGNIYTCDEGRMLAEMGNDSFKIGNVYENTYVELMQSNSTEAMCISSCIECLPYCHTCVYMPYCGTCPVINLAQDNNIFSKNPQEYRCKIYKEILNILFEYIENEPDIVEIFKKWIS